MENKEREDLQKKYGEFTGVTASVSDTELDRFQEDNPNILESQILLD